MDRGVANANPAVLDPARDVVAATHQDLEQRVKQGAFREDLFHRLNVVQFNLTPLRERGDDILLLAEHFLKTFRPSMNRNVTAITAEARQKLMAHRWPGNVRELRNVIERALILETNQEIQPSNLPDFHVEARLGKPSPVQLAADESLDDTLARTERDLINGALEQNNFSLTRAAERLKLTRHSLRYRMQRLGMNIGENAAGNET